MNAFLGDHMKVVDEDGLGHADTSVTGGQVLVGLVKGDVNAELTLGPAQTGVCQQGTLNFIESTTVEAFEISLRGAEGICRNKACQQLKLTTSTEDVSVRTKINDKYVQ